MFTDSEVDFLQEKYLEELQAVEKYAESLREIMYKLGADRKKALTESEILTNPVKKKRGRKPKNPLVETLPVKVPKKRGRKPKHNTPEDVATVPAYALDMKAPKKKKKGQSAGRKSSSSGMVNLAPMGKPRNIKDIILQKFPEMISKL